MKGRLLGVDFGTVRVGLAVSDPDRILASPLATYTRRDVDADAAYFRQVIAAEEIVGLIVGLPLHTDGREGVKAKEAREYGTWLGNVTGLQVEYADERFTTVFAESALWNAGLTHKRRKDRRDRVAAQMLLQSYIDGLAATRSEAEGSAGA
jgi:putative Holliday junction resolvase